MAAAYLPDYTNGWLPSFVFLVGVTAITNAVQCYNDISYLQRVYNPPLLDQKTNVKTVSTSTTIIEDISTPAADRRPSTISIAGTASPVSAVTPLSARTFGTWNIVVGIKRLCTKLHNLEAPGLHRYQLH
ncbi:ergosterol biosynthesis protein [Neophaeococcomyces mojaviensis]|uniref:Ergosterol biosynthesis protein n=1 Tax=Neophaeococcomyces mojaviensis TaxID=3383035 RepID=A0ACC2ZXT8_9EURO|nr:ergosterol biosynthesis protein [Knufia sp. JES_112]